MPNIFSFNRKILIITFFFLLGMYLFGFFSATYYWQQEVTATRRVPIYSVACEEKKAAITIDGVWGAELTKELLDIFQSFDLTITFFFSGYWLEDYPEVALAIHEAGHEIQNHSMTHPHLSRLGEEEIRREIQKTEDLIYEITGIKSRYFRPPFGDYNNLVIEVAEEMGYQTIQWSIDSLDWRDPGPDFIIRRVLDQVSKGSIILMHNNAPDTPKALLEIIPALLEEGYQLVPLSELVLEKNYYIEPHSGLQRPLLEEGDEDG